MPCQPPPATAAFELTRRRLLGYGAAAALGLAGLTRVRPTRASLASPRLRLIGEARLPHRLQFQGTTVGGLSGVDYDEASGLF
ncbi:MAG: hypothetical protein Q7T39_05900, partial [Polaromonas sp.]|nr:hypothetical protein [Polaromonas sp.]